MTRWCLIVALVFAAPGCHRQTISGAQSTRSVGIGPAADPSPLQQSTAIGGVEFKHAPGDNPAYVDLASPEDGSVPLSDGVRNEAVTSPPVQVPDANLENEHPASATVAPAARTPPSPAKLPAPPPPGQMRETMRNGSQAVAPRVPPPSTADPVTTLIERGDAMLALNDLGVARLLYERAAKAGNSRAATGVGKTYDPNFLRMEGAVGLQPNRSEAINWYQKATALGDPEAAARLRQLQN
jgi:hypothetical protein